MSAGPDTLRRVALASVIVYLVLGTMSNVLFLAAFQLRLDWFLEPALAVAGGPTSAGLLRWAAITDLLSYYLPLAPIALALRAVVHRQHPERADLATLGALAYVVVGSIGATAVAWAGPVLLLQYSSGTPDPSVTAADFRLLIEVVFRGLWQTLDPLLLAVWLIGIGRPLQSYHARFGWLSIVLGVAAVVLAVVNVLGLALLRDAALGAVFALSFAWGVWLAVLLYRRQLLATG